MEHFKKIYLDYKHQVYFFVKKYISTMEDAEDVVQEIFVHLWKHSSSLKNPQTLEAIIFKTAQQEVSNYYRKNKILFSYTDESLIKDEADPEKGDHEFKDEQLKKIEILMEELPERSKTFFYKNKLEKISYSQIAKENNISKTAVEKQVNKVIRYIKANLNLF
ncbi:sigma-70 family RNA polymerase sigma factor [Chryseobacterium indologenes]|uniref:Sigma-70 family RNA polymerase sigma factor n=1 Tax=Chryseobacterium shandongense TaxID=1493872 RepID=A0AAD0YD94_9FLAO|nr:MULTISPECIES: sigma-70 family RNA polymerase sigma factor [Chryseobacterium]AYZ35125.1 sigma-70 family RNA polymerase sigma factor [Chryseobacterium indologenes]AZA85418.1 sigma-70 family RNA polymerase sigma factor [Chryseobacterium shandongense]AZA97525.1 sigma-70 family RNA polymerase sigma factor [Chryseobacterium shandongense]MEB4762943.1 sigma-70 family RNA polymerase sigma factor [Chryseobacterium indologenes]UEQ78125.1 sigma-70 family RNA polymerase sigma factor [Chryseobacterium ar